MNNNKIMISKTVGPHGPANGTVLYPLKEYTREQIEEILEDIRSFLKQDMNGSLSISVIAEDEAWKFPIL